MLSGGLTFSDGHAIGGGGAHLPAQAKGIAASCANAWGAHVRCSFYTSRLAKTRLRPPDFAKYIA